MDSFALFTGRAMDGPLTFLFPSPTTLGFLAKQTLAKGVGS